MAKIRQGFNCNICGKGLGLDDLKTKCRECAAPKAKAARKAINRDYREERFGKVVKVEPIAPVDPLAVRELVSLSNGQQVLVNGLGEPIN